jgi:hypothetical protein
LSKHRRRGPIVPQFCFFLPETVRQSLDHFRDECIRLLDGTASFVDEPGIVYNFVAGFRYLNKVFSLAGQGQPQEWNGSRTLWQKFLVPLPPPSIIFIWPGFHFSGG